MAVRFDAAGDRLTRTASVPSPDANYTFCAWIYGVTWPGESNGIFIIEDFAGAGFFDALQVDASGHLGIDVMGNDYTEHRVVGASVIGTTTWAHVALVRSAVNLRTGYLNGVSELTNTGSETARGTPARMSVGETIHGGTTYTMNGRVAAIKIWTAALTAGEIAQEMYTIRPQRTANLHIWSPAWPGATERLADYSGNGYTWTAGGTLTDEDQPPISYGTYNWNNVPVVTSIQPPRSMHQFRMRRV